jgi:hypothetical protein
MSCTIAVFCLSNLYITGELTQQNRAWMEGSWCRTHWCRGPQAELTIGMKWYVTEHVVVDYGLKHTSFISEPDDRGQEVPFVSLTWRPFK